MRTSPDIYLAELFPLLIRSLSAELARINVEDLAQSAAELGSAAAVEYRNSGYLCPPKTC